MERKTKTSKYQVKRNSVYYAREAGELLLILQAILKDQSRTNIKSLLKNFQVIVEGSIVTQHDFSIQIGMKIEICWSKTRELVKLSRMKILFEDEFLIVIDKAPGLLSIATDNEREDTAYEQLKAYVKQTNPMNKIFVVHRLDRETSGVMLFAKTEEVQQRMQTGWQEIVKKRCYVALVEGTVATKEGEIVSWLKENSAFVTYSSPTDNGGKKAITKYKVLRENKFYTLIEAEIETGRKNQIRVHMQTLGNSIVGDKKYGATQNPLHRLGLHAHMLTFVHPTTHKELHFKTAIPQAFLNVFGKKR